MGLDISWYRNLVKMEPPPAEDGRNTFQLLHNDGFPGRAGQVEDGAVYVAERHDSFHVGPYGYYGKWRDWLAKLAGYPRSTDAEHPYAASAWAASEGPFWELINFSDCEGVIGAAVSSKLAKDFADFRVRALRATQVADDGETMDHYDEWQDAFTQAANNGAVEFH